MVSRHRKWHSTYSMITMKLVFLLHFCLLYMFGCASTSPLEKHIIEEQKRFIDLKNEISQLSNSFHQDIRELRNSVQSISESNQSSNNELRTRLVDMEGRLREMEDCVSQLRVHLYKTRPPVLQEQ